MNRSLKFVKDSSLEINPKNPSDLIIHHIDTDIIFYDMVSNVMSVIGGLSPTSTRMINNAVNFFEPSKVIDLNKGFKLYPKNNFSRPL